MSVSSTVKKQLCITPIPNDDDDDNNDNKCVSMTHIRRTQQLCATPRPLFKGIMSVADCMPQPAYSKLLKLKLTNATGVWNKCIEDDKKGTACRSPNYVTKTKNTVYGTPVSVSLPKFCKNLLPRAKFHWNRKVRCWVTWLSSSSKLKLDESRNESDQIGKFLKLKMADGRHFKIVFAHNSVFDIKRDIGRKTPIFHTPCHLTCTIS